MKKRSLLMATSLVLALLVATTGTLAYLSDTDSDVNVMTLGNVKIEQVELQRAEGVKHNATANEGDLIPFVEGQPLYPAFPVNGLATDYTAEANDLFKWGPYVHTGTAANGLWNDNKLIGAMDKMVFVKNTGASDAYFRTWIAFECPEGVIIGEPSQGAHIMINRNGSSIYDVKQVGDVEIEGTNYAVFCYTYQKALQPGQMSHPSLLQVVMTHHATNAQMELLGPTYEILAYTQAVQTVNFNSPEQALNAAFNGAPSKENHPWKNGHAGKVAVVANNDELKAAIEDADVAYIQVSGNLTYDWGGESYANSKALLMSGKTIAGTGDDASITFKGYGSANPITNVTLDNITVKDETVGDNEGSWEHGYLEFIGLTANNVVFDCTIMVGGDSVLNNCELDNQQASWYGLWVNSGNVTIKNSTFTGTRAVKIHEADGTEVTSVVVDNCTFTLSEKPGVVIGDLNANTAVTIKNSQFATQPGDQGKYIYESDTAEDTFNFSESNNKVMVTVKNATELATAVADGKTDIYLADGEYDVYGCGGKTLTISGGKGAVIKVMNEGEDGCDYGFDTSNVTFNGVTFNMLSNTGNYKGFARLNATYNDCAFVGAYTTHCVQTFNECTFNTKNGYIWTWGATEVAFNECVFDCDNTKAILAHGSASTKITVNNCDFKATEVGKTGAGDPVAAIEIDPVGSNVYTINFTGTNTITSAYVGYTRVKDGSTGHIITGVN